ncbi:MAG: GntR family transcriptional regulator [Sarcina sp.]
MAKEYLYEKIYSDLITKIEDGFYKKGDKIPTEQELTKEYNVSRMTIKCAIKMLVDEGYIERQSGVGSFVKKSTSNENKNENENELGVELPKTQGSSNMIGFILGGLWSSYGVETFDGIYDRADELGYDLVMKKSYGRVEKEGEALNKLVEMGADGIIIVPVHGEYYSQELLKLFVDGFPLVFIDRYLEGINIPVVSTDNVKASKDAVNYFIKKGHKHIGIVTTKDGDASTLNERKMGYIDALIENDIERRREYIFDQHMNYFTEGDVEGQYDEYINNLCVYFMENKELTAVFTTEYHTANIIKIALERLGKKIRDDIEVICFDQPRLEVGTYEFTFVEQNQKEMGRIAMDMLIDVINGKNAPKKTFIDAKLIEGNSTK